LLFASLALIAGYQSAFFALFAKVFSVTEGLLPGDARLAAFRRVVTLERTLVAGLVVGGSGVVLLVLAVDQWRRAGFGPLDYAQTMRLVVPGVTLSVLGFQTILGGFFLSLLGLRRPAPHPQ